MPVPSEPAEQLPDETMIQLNEGLKVCKKVVTQYRAALSRKPSSIEPVQLDQPAPPAQTD